MEHSLCLWLIAAIEKELRARHRCSKNVLGCTVPTSGDYVRLCDQTMKQLGT